MYQDFLMDQITLLGILLACIFLVYDKGLFLYFFFSLLLLNMKRFIRLLYLNRKLIYLFDNSFLFLPFITTNS